LEPVDLSTKCLKFFTPSLEDLIVTKLYAARETDDEDIKKIIEKGLYDDEKLAAAVKETEDSAISPVRYREMISRYEAYFAPRRD